jgi:hypothetical protein
MLEGFKISRVDRGRNKRDRRERMKDDKNMKREEEDSVLEY